MRSWPISRRTMLRGLGVAIALPMLDIMAGADEPAAAGLKFKPPRAPVRMLLMNMPCGTYRAEWGAVDKPGPLGELKPLLKPLQPFSGDLLLIGNLMNKAATVDGLAHYTNEANLWTSTVVKKTTGADLDVGGISVDQVAGSCTGAVTRFPSLHLGMMAPYGGVDSGWARVYDSQLSWSAPTTPVPNEIDPKRAFDRLFRSAGDAKTAGGANVVMPISEQDQRSVLDYVLDDATGVRRRASVADQRKLDEYLTSVRDVEKQLDREIKEAAKQRRVDPAATRAVGQLGGQVVAFDGKDHTKRLRLMLDLIVLGFWTDSTRVSTFMFGHERNDLNYSFIEGVKSSHHESSHWTESADKLAQYRRINLWHSEQVAYLLGRMKGIKEANGGTLLDNSMVFWGAALADGNTHGRENLPIMLAGRGGGVIKPGRSIQLPDKTPLANLYLSMLQCLGVQTTTFADSQKAIAELVG
ncbi:MAG: DUF1552 domain-containing protein [Planctomycetes bacterium]|nr:DUF1552 domain-containing protein [Planctomycetota bacterium]